MKPRPILRYHGGKWLLALWIISHLGPHSVYVEPFGGAASVLLRKERSRVEVYNDLWGTVVNVFRVLRDPEKADQLARMLYLTPFARAEFEQVTVKGLEELSDVEQARRTILRSFAGFGSASTNGDHATGFRAVSAKSSKKAALNWANYPEQIGGFVERLRGVIIENRPAIDVIRQHDSPQTFFYLDPPYPHCTRNMQRGNAMYAHELTDKDHMDLAGVVHKVAGMVIISGYDCELYRDLFGHWTQFEMNHIVDGGNRRVERIWLNPAAVATMPAPRLPLSWFDEPALCGKDGPTHV
jgi:DNA adenine methylase